MDFWIHFWAIVLGVALAVFACLAVVVTVGGFFDIKALFRSIESKHRRQEQEQQQTPQDGGP